MAGNRQPYCAGSFWRVRGKAACFNSHFCNVSSNCASDRFAIGQIIGSNYVQGAIILRYVNGVAIVTNFVRHGD